tara:strand:- start:979 stop:2112 length:1134 start_codon:yes stop_codon:yes gene_type:complete
MQLVVYGLKRHWLPMVLILLAGGGTYYGYTFMAEQAGALEKASAEFKTAKGKLTPEGLPPWGPNEENLRMAEKNSRRISAFIQEANGAMLYENNVTQGSVFLRNVLKDRIQRLNQMATNTPSGIPVVLPKENLGAIKEDDKENYPKEPIYHFTFGCYHQNLHLNRRISKSDEPYVPLITALKDVENICGEILFASGIKELVEIQRVKFPFETKTEGFGQDFLKDMAPYENETATGMPYLVKFRANPAALSTVLTRVCTFNPKGNGYYIIRSISIDAVGGTEAEDTTKKANGATGSGGALMPGGTGAPKANQPQSAPAKKSALPEAVVKALVDTKQASLQATPVVGPDLIEVKLHLDIIRKKPPAPEPVEGNGGGDNL